MSRTFTRRRCRALTALPVAGVGVTAAVESLGLPESGPVRFVLYAGFLAAVVGGGAAFLAWGRFQTARGRLRLGAALERGVGAVFVSWVGWSLVAELAHPLPHSLAVLEGLVLATAVVADAALAVATRRFGVDLGVA